MIGDFVLLFGPALFGLAYLMFVVRRFQEVADGRIRPEFGEAFHRSEQPGRYWLYVAVYLTGILLSLLALAWAALWIGVIWDSRH